MTESDLQTIEERLSITLPGAYRATMLHYSLPPESFGTEAMLPDTVEAILDLNMDDMAMNGVLSPFFIGSDLGEECYFLDASRADSPVYVYQLETGKHQVLDATMEQYVDRIRRDDAEAAADDAAAEMRHLNRKWWEFWK
ncbi:MAG: SMI1/KNR4 family protein [bacterium]|nr:SMI1/KNR4 family protein [bacterium]